jgi:hypothetical protein
MAISINWGTRIISVPKADMSLVDVGPPEIRELDLNDFHLTLKDLEDNEAGMPYPDTHVHNTEVVLGSITLARVIEIINGYTVTFEDGNYQVDLVGANSNVSDVTNLNSVGLRSYNSAGLITFGGADASSIADAIWDEVLTGATHNVPSSAGRRLRQLGDVISGEVTDASPTTTSFISDVSASYDNFFNDQLIRFTTGNLEGLARPVSAYDFSTQRFTLEEAAPVPPANGDTFDVIPVHVHPMSEIGNAILTSLVEGTVTLQQAQRLMMSVLAGKSRGGGTTSIQFRDIPDTKDRIDETVDTNGNRLNVGLDLT